MTREEAIRKIERVKNLYAYESDFEALDMAIDALKAVKSGKWSYATHYGDRYRVCSVCHAERRDDLSSGWYFCPNCGAEMNSD